MEKVYKLEDVVVFQNIISTVGRTATNLNGGTGFEFLTEFCEKNDVLSSSKKLDFYSSLYNNTVVMLRHTDFEFLLKRGVNFVGQQIYLDFIDVCGLKDTKVSKDSIKNSILKSKVGKPIIDSGVVNIYTLDDLFYNIEDLVNRDFEFSKDEEVAENLFDIYLECFSKISDREKITVDELQRLKFFLLKLDAHTDIIFNTRKRD